MDKPSLVDCVFYQNIRFTS